MRLLAVSIFLLAFFEISAQVNNAELPQVVKTQADQMGVLYTLKDFKGFIGFYHPTYLRAVGEAKIITSLKTLDSQVTSKGMAVTSVTFDPPAEILESKNELQCVLSQHAELTMPKARAVTTTTFIAFSSDQGKNWKFVDTSVLDIVMLRKLFPNLHSKIAIPPKQKPVVYPN